MNTPYIINKGIGNNAFSYTRKPERPDLKTTPLRKGFLHELQLGSEVVFHDFDEDQWVEHVGLQNGILSHEYGLPLYVIDNHNHAFWCWADAFNKGVLPSESSLIHIDAHYDDREPSDFEVDLSDMKDVERYTHEVLQIATFIQPALHHGLFRDVQYFVESAEFEKDLPELIPERKYVIDLDLDVFCDEMSHVQWQQKIDVMKHFLPQTCAITMATSPFFIDQQKAIDYAHKVVAELFPDSV